MICHLSSTGKAWDIYIHRGHRTIGAEERLEVLGLRMLRYYLVLMMAQKATLLPAFQG